MERSISGKRDCQGRELRARWEERRGSKVGSEEEKGVKNKQGMVVNREGRRG